MPSRSRSWATRIADFPVSSSSAIRRACGYSAGSGSMRPDPLGERTPYGGAPTQPASGGACRVLSGRHPKGEVLDLLAGALGQDREDDAGARLGGVQALLEHEEPHPAAVEFVQGRTDGSHASSVEAVRLPRSERLDLTGHHSGHRAFELLPPYVLLGGALLLQPDLADGESLPVHFTSQVASMLLKGGPFTRAAPAGARRRAESAGLPAGDHGGG